MRVIGILFVMGGCIGGGFWFRFSYARKLQNLWGLHQAIQILQGEIIYGRTPLPQAFEQTARRTQGNVKLFLTQVSERLYEGGASLQEIWNLALEEQFSATDMRKDDRELTKELGAVLGYLDVEMQKKSLNTYMQRLGASIQEFTEEKKNRMRLYPMLGTMCGALICLVIL